MSRFSQLGNDLYSGRRSFDIVGRRWLWYAISAVLIALSLVGLLGRGLNFGLEFTGGSEFRVTGSSSTGDYETRARQVVDATLPGSTTTVTKVGSDTLRVQTGELSNAQAEQVRAGMATEFGVPVKQVTSSIVGPSWGQTVTQKAFISLGVFLALVSVVLALYFRTWKMAFAALVALVHDVVFTVGTYALLGIEVSPASVVGFLTILGYSIYDTIVVFDKVRENTQQAFATQRETFAEAANHAVNQTIVRSINTSVVALLPVVTILIVGQTKIGPGTLLDLSWALFIGIAVGTFSSIFIAPPLLVHLREGEASIRRHDAAVLARRQRGEVPAPGAVDREAATVGATSAGATTAVAPQAGAADPHSQVGAIEPQPATPDASAEPTTADPAATTGRATAADPHQPRELHPYAQRGTQSRRRPRR